MLSTLSAVAHSNSNQSKSENGLRPKVLMADDLQCRANILDRMQYYKVSGVSIAVVNNNTTEWVHGYGNITSGPNAAQVDEHILFQAGSISKPITAFGALLLVQQGKVNLDDDINIYLKRWKVPQNELTINEKVTLRRLLSHTAGTNVSGFPGYTSQDSIPTALEILNGKKPRVNTDPVIVISQPGTEHRYSGGGTTIVQILIEDITGEPFVKWMQSNVLTPLGMVDSTFMQPLPTTYDNHAAYGHHQNGVVVEGKWHIYPELAAAGLWSTPKDLAQFIIYLQTALKGENTKSLNTLYVKEMISRQKIGDKNIDSGLGLFLENEGKELLFKHDGQNDGFIARLLGYAYRGQGIIIMMNNDSGWGLMDEITNSVADTYHWPYSSPTEKRAIAIDPTSLKEFPGKYFNGDDKLEISLRNNKLFLEYKSGFGPLLLFPSTKCNFFIQQEDLDIEFLDCEVAPKSLTLTDSKGVKTVFRKTNE